MYDNATNVGIGTTSPGEKFEVAGNVLSKFSSTNGSGFLQYSSTTHIFSLTRQTNDVSLSGYDGVGLAPNATSGPSTSYALYAKSNGNVGIGTTSPSYKLEVNGSFAATSKSFLIKHPTREGMKLQYGSLESPYHGVRLTGEGKIVNGECTIKLPDYIHGLVKQEGSQVQITNIKHGKVIWVEDIDVENDIFTVKCDVGWLEAKKEYRFYWSFTAIRKDIKDLEVEV